MTRDDLQNTIGFQIGFLKYSGKPEEDVINSLVKIASKYADQETSSLRTQLTEMTAEKEKWFDKYTIESQKVDILDGELRVTQKKMEVLASMLDKGTNPSVFIV